MNQRHQNSAVALFKKGGSVGTILSAIILMSIIWGVLSPYYFTPSNIRNIGTYVAANGIMAAGLTITLVMGGLDLSQISLMALCGMVAGIGYQSGMSGPLLLLIAACVGILGGAFNGMLITFMGINPFIATLGTQLVYRGLAFIITNGHYITVHGPMIQTIGTGSFLQVPIMFWIMLVVYLLIGFVMKYTLYGRDIYSIGGNEQAAHLCGIAVPTVKMISYTISGLSAGIAAILYIAQGSVALNNAGTGSEMDVMTAAILGGLSLTGGKGTVLNTFMGVVLLSVIANGMSLLSIGSYYQMLIKGLILIIAVFLDVLRETRQQ
jgi:ribose transport system permease protein